MRQKVKKYASTGGYPQDIPTGKSQPGKKKKGLYNILLVFFITVFVVSLGLLLYQLYDYYYADKIVSDLKQMSPTVEQLNQLPEHAQNEHLAALFAEYPDFRGWVSIAGTKVDNPVAQATDNEYYLHHTLDKEWLRLGTVFADYRNTFDEQGLSTNTILYGHHARNGKYFKDLINYKQLSFYQEHPFVSFETMYEYRDWVIVGAFHASLHKGQGELFEYYNYIDGSQADFYAFMDEVNRRSYFHTNIPVDHNDKLLTLSTCDYDFDDARFVVVARQLREGETAETMDIQATEHQQRYMPDAWYQAKGKKNPNQ